jgi:hypothetical protein
MRVGTKLGAFAAVLAAAFAVGAAVGAVAGPVDVGDEATHDNDGEMSDSMSDSTELPASGLLVSQDGYHFVPEDRLADTGEFAFTIIGPDGDPVTNYDLLHDRQLHLIVASRDLQQFDHLHPVRDAHGRWSVELPTLPAGAYRAFADFQPSAADRYTLGVDLVVPGVAHAMEPLHATTSDIVDGYDVTLTHDSSEVTITVHREGEVVPTEAYLGAAGHLVALRDGDLAYVHVHPLDDQPAGPVSFALDVPSAGKYALFFDFQLDGVVHTARFVLDIAGESTGSHTGASH